MATLPRSHKNPNSKPPSSTGLHQNAKRFPFLPRAVQKIVSSGTSKRNHSNVAPWTFEIAATMVSIAAILAIIIILYHQDGKPQAAWNFVLTLSTVISTLGTLARTSLAFALSACIGQQKWNWLSKKPDSLVCFKMFDEASRGPWGSSRLFVWLRARHWATLGALAVIGTIAFDPFLQAVITTYGQLDDASQQLTATIGQAHKVTWSFGSESLKIPEDFLAFFKPKKVDAELVSSIYTGFYDVSSSDYGAGTSFCITGNCTWPIFSTIAVCSSCEDVSKNQTIRYNAELRFPFFDPIRDPQFQDSDYHIDGLIHFNDTFGNLSIPYTRVSYNVTTYILPYTEISQKNTSIAEGSIWFEVGATTEVARTVKFRNLTTLPIATECALYLCAKAYSTIMQSNVLQEIEIQSWAFREPSSHQVVLDSEWNRELCKLYAELPDPGKREYRIGRSCELLNGNRSLDVDLFDIQMERSDLLLRIPIDRSKSLPKEMVRQFNVSDRFISNLISHLSSVTTTSVKGGVEIVGQSMPVFSALYDSTNLTATFANVAKSLTNQMRRSSKTKHHGVAQQWVIHFRVRWWYLAYPIVLLAMGIVYIGLVVWESVKQEMPAWKEGAMPTLAYGLGDETQRVIRDERERKTLKVKFAWDEKDGCKRLLVV